LLISHPSALNIIHTLYENLFSSKPFSVYFMKQKKKTLNKSSGGCSAGGGSNNATVGYPVSVSLLPEPPAIRTMSVHPETPEEREAPIYETITPYRRVQASTGYRPHLYRASVRRWRHIWHLLRISRLGFHWKWQMATVLCMCNTVFYYCDTTYAYYMHYIFILSSGFILSHVYPLLGNDSVNTFPREPTRKNRTSIVRQRISKHASLTTEAVFSAWSVRSGYKEAFNWAAHNINRVVSFETPACRDMSLGAEELNWVESSELTVAEKWQ
jgi:hypothetical protein